VASLQAKSSKTPPDIGDQRRQTMPDGRKANRDHQLVRNYHEQSALHSGAVNAPSRPKVETGDEKSKENKAGGNP
jgi:hypothetical protein